MTTATLKEKLQTGTPGHKWRPGHRETTATGTPGGTGGYISNDGDTGNRRLAITINKAQRQSLESWGIDLNTCVLVSRSSFIFPVSWSSFVFRCPSLKFLFECPGRHLYSLCPGCHLCPNSKTNVYTDRNTGNMTDEITDWDTNDNRDTGNINDDRDTQSDITDWESETQITTETQGI